MNNIIETIRDIEELSMFADIIDLVGMKPLLTGEGPFTVFAPSNDALVQITDEEIDQLDQNPTLTRGMVYAHIVLGKLLLSDIMDRSMIFTITEDEMTISDVENTLKINASEVKTADIECSNGIVHVIDYPLKVTRKVIMEKVEAI
ncbi:MAG: fasciclin domain-containing protein [Methanomassiliicoccus sp.]|nr:fasciclin domain-containing protein [Methanomassiliicoccus sp.]